MKTKKLKTRDKRKMRTRGKIKGTALKPRISVFRSHLCLYVQIIDDHKMATLIGGNDKQLDVPEKNKVKRAFELGKIIAGKAVSNKIESVVFDRSGYTYHGRVKALAEGLRKGGLKF